MTESTKTPKSLGFDCRHVFYSESETGNKDDILFIKLQEVFDDGTRRPVTKMVKNFEREFWVTKKAFQKHTDKKEFEDLDKVQVWKTTQSKITDSVSRALGKGPTSLRLNILNRSPYVYGTDITTPVLMKQKFRDRWPDVVGRSTVAALDIETDVINNPHTDGRAGPIIMIGLTFGSKAILTVSRKFLGTIVNPEAKIQEKFVEYLNDYIVKRGLKLEIVLCSSPEEMIKTVMDRAHQWQPDFISIYNMAFDLVEMLRALEKANWNAADIFSDPRVPPEFRKAKFHPGKTQKITASGKVEPLAAYDRWPTLNAPASFFFIDSMCVYKKIRTAKGNESSYTLDYTLEKNLGVRKLKFDFADEYTGLEWHEVMQRDYPIEYCIYNLFDCIGLELLDEKVNDLGMTVPLLCHSSQFFDYPSNPKRLAEKLHFFAQKHGRVWGSTSDNMVDDNDKHVLGMKNWIVTLPSELVEDNGLFLFEDLPEVRSMIRTNVNDLDVTGAYPTGEVILNISKETTWRELCRIKGVSEGTQRFVSINLASGGTVNSVDFCQRVHNMPKLDVLLADFQQTQQPRSVEVPQGHLSV